MIPTPRMMMRTRKMLKSDNPVRDAMLHDEECEAYTNSLPTCDVCGEPIDEWFYEFDGEKICEKCADKLRVYVDTYMEMNE